MRRLTPFLVLLLAATIAPLAPATRALTARAATTQAESPIVAQQLTQLPPYREKEDELGTDNSVIAAAERIDGRFASWTRTVTGTIGSSADVDYYLLTVTAPASVITLTLTGPEADYDLVLGGGVDTSQTEVISDVFESGLEQVTQIGGSINAIGGSINAIGGSINAIGGSINAIGGSINAIGGSINAIGGSINAISANANTASEEIATQIWLPGEYYIVVTTSNGQFSKDQPYTLRVELAGSGLARPPAAPEVEAKLFAPPPLFDATQITTLYIYNSGRMAQRYPSEASLIGNIQSHLSTLMSSPPGSPGPLGINNAPTEYGIAINLSELLPVGGTTTITDVYTLWDNNRGNPLYANLVAGVIDNVIEAVIKGGASGPNPKFSLGFATGPVSFPNIQNVVLVGGDDVIPYYRLPDLTTYANESDYAAYLRSLDASGIIRPDSPQGAALRYRMLQSDSPYGSDKPYRFYGYPFFVPRLAVGRLVETPAEIENYLSGYAGASIADFKIDATTFESPGGPTRASVSGYDFLKDEAAAIGAVLGSTGLQPNEVNTLINDTWNRADLAQQWFDGALDLELPVGDAVNNSVNGNGAEVDLSSINAHFDHWQLLPANDPSGTKGQTFPALRLLNTTYPVRGEPPPYYVGTLGYSVGCHSGLNVLASSLATNLPNAATYGADFAQAFAWHGGNWVGNTGYGYGTADGIDYSERLAVIYTQELARETLDPTGSFNTGARIGEALVKAKQRYVRNAASLSAYDYKVVSIMTFYGLPFLRVDVTSPLTPPAEEPTPGQAGSTPQEVSAPRAPDQTTGRLTRTITFTVDVDASDFKPVPRTGSTIYDLDPADFTVQDEFDQIGPDIFKQQVRTFNNNQIGAPTLPTFAYDIGARNSQGTDRLRVLDVVFVSGIYSGTAGFDPQVTQIATETESLTPLTSRGDEPAFTAGAGIWYPDKFFGYSTVGQGDEQHDQLTSFAAQFKADASGERGLLRPYRQLVFKVIYDDPIVSSPTANALDTDTTPPTITSVTIDQAGAGVTVALAGKSVITVKVDGLDDDGAAQGFTEVSGVFLVKGTEWVPLAFKKVSPGVYVTDPLDVSATGARFIVRATDKAGNTTYYTAKGMFNPMTVVSLPLVSR